MSQFKRFSFGVDSVSFEDADKNVYGLKDVTTATLDLSFETSVKRGGINNEVRATAVHSRKAELTIETGYADIKLGNLLSGGTVTSLGTSAATITTAISTLAGTTSTIVTATTSTIASTPSLVKSDKYYLEALTVGAVSITRVSDGSVIGSYSLTANGTIAVAGEGILILTAATGTASLTIGEKAYFQTRSTINSFNNKITFNLSKPTVLTCNITVDFNGARERLTIPNVQPTGQIEMFSATEFRARSLTMPVYFDETLDRIAEIHATS